MPHKTSGEIVVTPLNHDQEKKTNFGAVVTGADLNNLDESSFQKLREAVYTHNVVILKGQEELLPAKQFEFVYRFDPDSKPKHGFGTGKGVKELGDLGKKPFYHIPGAGGVTLVGHGYQGENHYGLENITLDAISHVDFHKEPLSADGMARGFARFNAWHFDGIIHASHPSRVTTFRCVRAPRGPDVTVLLDDDDTGRTMKCLPGSTGFINSSQIYNMLTDEEKAIADNSFWEPAPHPFAWYGTRRMRSTGLGLAPGGESVPLDKLPDWSSEDIYRYPLVWLNPGTGEKGFQVMPELVHKLYLKDSPSGPERIMDDVEEIRLWLNNIFDRIMSPEFILIPPADEGDVVVWNNWGVMHSAIEYPLSYGPRAMHQCHIASSTAPLGPQHSPIEGTMRCSATGAEMALTSLHRWLYIITILCMQHTRAHSPTRPTIHQEETLEELEAKWGTDWPFSGISTFGHLKHVRCLTEPQREFDLGIIGAPFDTAVSYRPGARFGPRAIRAASARQTSFRGFNHRAGINPYNSWATILDCGDIPITPFDNELALSQMTLAYKTLLSRPSTDPQNRPVLLTLGGDHSVALPALRALRDTYDEPIAVLHFDAHLDTLHPGKYPSAWTTGQGPSPSDFTHGTMFWIASSEGLIRNGTSVHGGLRSRLAGDDYSDYEDDSNQGFMRIEADDIDFIGVQGIIGRIMNRMGVEVPVYLSIDIDVIDPGLAPGTGTPEPGGWTTRELIQILRGIESLNIVGADIVEVSPVFDGPGEQTALAAAQIVYEIMTSVVKKGMPRRALKVARKEEQLWENIAAPVKATKPEVIKDEL